MPRLIVKYSDVDIEANDVELSRVMNAFGSASFKIASTDWENYSTWISRIHDEIEIYLDSTLIFVGYIYQFQLMRNFIKITVNSFTWKLSWDLLDEEQVQFLLSEGLVTTVNATYLFYSSEKGLLPTNIDGTAIEDDEFNQDPASPNYVVVSDATLGESEISSDMLSYSGNEESSSGDVDDTHEYDSTYLEVHQTYEYNTVLQTTFLYDISSESIDKDYPMVKFRLQLIGYMHFYRYAGYDILAETHFPTFKVYLTDPTGTNEYLVFDKTYSHSYAFMQGNHTEPYAYNSGWITLDLSNYINDNGTYWDQGKIRIEISDPGFWTNDYNYIDFVQIELRYDSAEFEDCYEKIDDTEVSIAFPLEVRILPENSLDGKGIAPGDKVQISKGADEVYDLIFSEFDYATIINLGSDVDKPFTQNYKGGLSYYMLLLQANQRFSYEYWENYEESAPRLFCAKVDDVDAATYTYNLENNPPSSDPVIQFSSSETYGYVQVRYAQGTTSRIQADSPSSDPKTIIIDAPEIITRTEANDMAKEWANYYATPRYSISLVWEYVPTEFPEVGNKYNIYINDSLTLSDQICRRLSISQDGAQGAIKITGYFGNGHTPPDEKLGREIGLLRRRESLRSSLDLIATTRQTILSYAGHTPATVNAPLAISDQDISLPLGNGLEIDGTDQLAIDISDIIEDNPSNGEFDKAPCSDWAYDHENDDAAHHEPYTDADVIDTVEAEPSLDLTGYVQAKDHTTDVQDYVITEDQKGIANGICPLNAYTKVPTSNVPAFVWGNYIDTWDASSGYYPTGDQTAGNYYICSVAGIVNSISYAVGDIIIWDGTEWDSFNPFQPNLFAYLLNCTQARIHKTITEKIEIRGKHHYEFGTTIEKRIQGYSGNWDYGDYRPAYWDVYTQSNTSIIANDYVYQFYHNGNPSYAYAAYDTRGSLPETGSFIQVDFLMQCDSDVEWVQLGLCDDSEDERLLFKIEDTTLTIRKYHSGYTTLDTSSISYGNRLLSIKLVNDGTYWDAYFYVDKVLIHTELNLTRYNYYERITIYAYVTTSSLGVPSNYLLDIGFSQLYDYIPFSLGELEENGVILLDDVTITDILTSSDSFSDSDEKLMTAATIKQLDKICFSATSTSGQSISSGSATEVNWATEDFDSHSAFASNTFTATEEGQYYFEAQITYAYNSWTQSKYANIELHKNGSMVRREIYRVKASISQRITLKVSGMLDLNVNDTVTIETYQNQGSARTLESNTGLNYFHGEKYSDIL